MNRYRKIDIAAVKEELTLIEREREMLRKALAALRVRNHRLKKLLEAAHDADRMD